MGRGPGRPRKTVTEAESSEQLEMPLAPAPIPVKVMNTESTNPWAGKYPSVDDPIETRRYKFTYNQNPGMPLEFTKGRSLLNRWGKPTILQESYCFEDDNIYEMPCDVAKHLNGLVYYEEGRARPRCTCIEVD